MFALKAFIDATLKERLEKLTGWVRAALIFYMWGLWVFSMPGVILALSLGTVYADLLVGVALMGYFVWISILAVGMAIPFAGIAMLIITPLWLNNGALSTFGLSMADWPVATFFWVTWTLGLVGQILLDYLVVSGALSGNLRPPGRGIGKIKSAPW